MKQEILELKLLTPVTEAKDGMFTTMNEIRDEPKYFKGRDKSIHRMLLGTHSPLNAVRVKVKAWVTDRCHTHLRTHHGVADTYWCGSSRKDLSHGVEHEHKGTLYRLISFQVDLKRFVEISRRRLCPSAHIDVRLFWTMVCDQLFELVPELKVHAGRPCIFVGMCTEGMTDCGFVDTPKYKDDRIRLEQLAYALRKSSNPCFWDSWKENYCTMA